MRFLVTGACGFIGSVLAKRLAAEGHEVVANDLPEAQWEATIGGAEVERLASRFSSLELGKIGHLDGVFHQAAISDPSYPDARQVMQVNYSDSIVLADQCIMLGIPFVYASSAAVYGNSKAPNREFESENPLNPYGSSKLALDRYLAGKIGKAKTQILGLRYFNVYGPGEEYKKKGISVVRNFINSISKNQPPDIYGDGSQKRDFVYIDDIIGANITGFGKKASGIINIGSGQSEDFNYIVGAISRTMGKKCAPRHIPNPNAGAYQTNTQADLEKARMLIGYEPKFGIDEGIKEYLRAIDK